MLFEMFVIAPENIENNTDAITVIDNVTVERVGSAEEEWSKRLSEKDISKETRSIVNNYLDSVKDKEVNQLLIEKTFTAFYDIRFS